MKQPYRTQLSTGYQVLFTASCLCEAKWKQKQFNGRYLRPFPTEDFELMKQLNSNI